MRVIKNENTKLITFPLVRFKLNTRRLYETRAYVRRAMDQYATKQTAMQDDIDTLKTKMDQLMEMLTAQHTREEERATTAAAAAGAVSAAVATANNATAIVPPVVTENMRTLRGDTPFPGVQAHNPPFYGMHVDFFDGADNQGNAAATHAATQTRRMTSKSKRRMIKSIRGP